MEMAWCSDRLRAEWSWSGVDGAAHITVDGGDSEGGGGYVGGNSQLSSLPPLLESPRSSSPLPTSPCSLLSSLSPLLVSSWS